MSEDKAVQHAPPGAGTPESVRLVNQGGAGQPDTAGSVLREARVAKGLDIDTLAALLKVPVQKLEALEKNQLDLLPDAVFARALASSMCRILKLDPAPILQRLPAITAFKVTSQNRGINTPFRSRSANQGPAVWSHISRPAVLVGLALLLGALIMVFLPAIQQEIARYRQTGQSAANQGGVVEPALITTPVVTIQNSGGGDAAGIVPNPSSGSLSPAEVPAFVSTPATSLSPATATDSNAGAMVTFSAKSESLIKVTDANGVVVLERVLNAGESAGASGALPLVVVASRAGALQVQVRGKPFNLAAVSKRNIARFEVK